MQWKTMFNAVAPFTAVVVVGCAAMGAKPARYVYFVQPPDGATVPSPFAVSSAWAGWN